jgi:hypothetical protein
MGIALEARRLDQVRESLARAPVAEVRALRPSNARKAVPFFHRNLTSVCVAVYLINGVSICRVRGQSF